MKPIRYSLLLTLCGLFVIWLFQVMSGQLPSGFFGWRNALVQGSGILAFGCMSVAMLLAVRPVLLEKTLNGLDKMYRLHKWLGISALILAFFHWFVVNAPKWNRSLNLFDLGARPRRPASADLGAVEQLFRNLRSFAEGIGEYAFYLAAALIVLALLRRFPYRYFLKSHRLLAVTYLAFVVHAVVLMNFSYWSGLIGLVMGVLLLAGTVCALLILFKRVGKSRQVQARVTAVERYADNAFLTFEVLPETPWAAHQAGQFAFLTFEGHQEAHPFTIASAMREDRQLRFVIKGLGDATRHLFEHLKVGDAVQLEGPYGRFVFDGKNSRQIWIAGGIGVTPFMARLDALTRQGDGREIDFFYCAASHDARFIKALEEQAEAAKIRLYVRQDVCDGFLDAEKLAAIVPAWQQADFWFCGPTAFGKALKDGLVARGLDEAKFHQEAFEMR